MVYADFESIMKTVNENVGVTQVVETGRESPSHVFQEHTPCSFAYKVVSSVDPDFLRPLVMYRGEDVAEKFVCDLQLETPKPMLLTANHDRLTVPLSVIYAQNHLEMIRCETIITLQEIIVVLLTTSVI